jgi:hypothetical protein
LSNFCSPFSCSPPRLRPLFFKWGKGRAVIAYPYKAVKHGDNADWQLFKIDVDRTETNDIAADHPEIVQAMNSAWQTWFERSMSETPAPPTAAEQVFPSGTSVRF